MITTITELKKELDSVRKQIKHLYQTFKGKYSDEWFHKNIWPLCQKETELQEKIEAIKLLNVKVGTGMTFSCYTDRHACTVIKRTAKSITVQEDRAVRTDDNGMSDCQTYKYYRDKKGLTKTFRWSEKKGWVCGTYRCWLGRDEYYDFSF